MKRCKSASCGIKTARIEGFTVVLAQAAMPSALRVLSFVGANLHAD
jgi:hypothetical protein